MRHVPSRRSEVALLLRQHSERLSPHVEDEIEYRQIGNEFPVLLRIGGMGIVVPDHLDAGRSEARFVEVVLRGIARDIPGGAEMMTEVDEALVAVASNLEFGCPGTRWRDADLCGEPIDEREVEVHEARPRPIDDLAEPRQDGVDEGRARVELADCRQMLAPPILPIVDLDIENRLSRASVVENGNGQPDGALRTLPAVAVAPTVLVELHVVVMHEHVGFLQEVEISEPGQIARLQDHERCHENLLRVGMDLLRSPAPAGEIMLPYSFASATDSQCAA